MPNDKKKIIYIVVSVLVVVLIAAGTVLALSLFNKKANSNTTNNKTNTSQQDPADQIKTQAIEVLHTDPAKAKSLLDQALQLYKKENNKSGEIDVEAQLSLLQHSSTSK